MRQVNVLLGLALFALPIPASADTITLMSSATSVYADASVSPSAPIGVPVQNQPNLTTSMTVTTANGQAVSSAFLTSSVDATTGTFMGQGGTAVTHSSTGVFSGGYAQTDFGVWFELSEPLLFTFAASFATSGGGGNSRSIWSAELFYYPADVATTAFRFAGGDTGRVSTSGALVPGRYSFFVNSASSSFAIGDRNTTADFDFTLQVGEPVAAPTPEPATVVLLMTGVAGVVARQRMRGHR